MSTTQTAPLVEVPDELRETLTRAARAQFGYLAGEQVPDLDTADPASRRAIIDDLSHHHAVCAALEGNEVGQGMFPADAVHAAAEWALDDVRSRLQHDSGWTIDEAAEMAATGRALLTLLGTCGQ